MKCWAVQKLLPLYVGDDDLPIFQSSIQNHLGACPVCSQAYSHYQASRKMLQGLKNMTVASPITPAYWAGIQHRIHHIPQKPKPILFSTGMWLPIGAIMAALLLIATIVTFPELYFRWDSPPTPMTSKINHAPVRSDPSVPAIPAFPRSWTDPQQNTRLLNIPLYQLDEGRPLHTQAASF